MTVVSHGNILPPLTDILPDPRTLMGPGPSNVHPRVLGAMAQPTVGHLDPTFQQLMEEIKQGLRYAFQTKNALTFPVSAPGSAGMEMCFANLMEAGDKVIVARNGVFGARMLENVTRFGGIPVDISFGWGTAIDPNRIEQALKDHPDAKILAFVHAETSTGVLSDAESLCALAQAHDCLTIVDAVTSLGGVPVKVDDWGIDAVYSGSQKCLSCPPGLSPVSFSDRAIARLRARTTPVPSWFLDLTLVMDYWDGAGGRTYHHTAPVNAMYALYESLLLLQAEGLERAWTRHRVQHENLVAGLEELGLSLPVDPAVRLPQLNLVTIPDGKDDGAVRAALLSEYGLEIGAGLGTFAGKAWRIGLMGHTARPENVAICLKALSYALSR
ncbi:MAG: alanine--glyoxylate aminotransferase family protein [Alphaproteobacteria bacterium]|nr:alanine--glyoxylate aminotransferase family protein [Alphaproteobacteria bacterium]